MTMQFPKPAASLSSALLARKGAARPGQRYTQDMSFVEPVREAFQQDPIGPKFEHAVPEFTDVTQNAIANDVAPADQLIEPIDVELKDAEPQPLIWATKAPLEKSQPLKVRLASGQKPRSAFTLRLDPERHLNLRLVSAHQHRSAQVIVTEALDRYLADFNAEANSGTCVCSTQTTV